MTKKTYEPDARGRILEAAKTIFAKKGFDGSRVDEIAKKANVPKSLIYYHFKGKDAILEELLGNCLQEYKQTIKSIRDEQRVNPGETIAEQIREVYWKFLEANEDIIRIISMEALKKNSSKTHLTFKFVELLMQVEAEYIPETRDLSDAERSQRMVTEFFTSFTPLTIFFCFRHAWADYFQSDSEDLVQQFLKAYDSTYGAFRRQK